MSFVLRSGAASGIRCALIVCALRNEAPASERCSRRANRYHIAACWPLPYAAAHVKAAAVPIATPATANPAATGGVPANVTVASAATLVPATKFWQAPPQFGSQPPPPQPPPPPKLTGVKRSRRAFVTSFDICIPFSLRAASDSVPMSWSAELSARRLHRVEGARSPLHPLSPPPEGGARNSARRPAPGVSVTAPHPVGDGRRSSARGRTQRLIRRTEPSGLRRRLVARSTPKASSTSRRTSRALP